MVDYVHNVGLVVSAVLVLHVLSWVFGWVKR